MAFVSAIPVNVHKRPVSLRNTTTNSRSLCMAAEMPKAPAPANRASYYFKFMNASKKNWSQLGTYGLTNTARSILHEPSSKVDDYIAQCARRQYIAAQNNSGVYNTSCTEATVSGAAEDSRVASLAASFRWRQVRGPASFADYYETRKFARGLAQGCNYEESLVNRFPMAASMTILGTAEKEGACGRYAMPGGTAEEYMQSCVERAASARATPNGVYNGLCLDGTVKGAAEAKRVAGLATKYRNGFMGPIVKLQMQYNQSKFARDYFSNGCDYEDGLFTKYPATAAAMRPDYARY